MGRLLYMHWTTACRAGLYGGFCVVVMFTKWCTGLRGKGSKKSEEPAERRQRVY